MYPLPSPPLYRSSTAAFQGLEYVLLLRVGIANNIRQFISLIQETQIFSDVRSLAAWGFISYEQILDRFNAEMYRLAPSDVCLNGEYCGMDDNDEFGKGAAADAVISAYMLIAYELYGKSKSINMAKLVSDQQSMFWAKRIAHGIIHETLDRLVDKRYTLVSRSHDRSVWPSPEFRRAFNTQFAVSDG